jgi:NAD+ synthase
MQVEKVVKHIVEWISLFKSNKGYVVGISGGVDSAVVSALCAETERPVLAVNMPISFVGSPKIMQKDYAWRQLDYLRHYENVSVLRIDLTRMINAWKEIFIPHFTDPDQLEFSMANAMSRLRMVALYTLANSRGLLVAGTGNKVEDFGVGFFTKYGDGGVDISPIGNLMKSEVREVAHYLKIYPGIISQTPSDGLWHDKRSDETQLGLSYNEIEWAMNFDGDFQSLKSHQQYVLKRYMELHNKNRHKVSPIPVCEIPKEFK